MRFLIVTLHCYADISSIGLPLPFVVLLAALGVPLGLTVVLSALRNAPEGYEDEEGFHWARRGFRGRHPLGLRVVRPTTQSKHARILFPSYEI
jgi:hypothetical protein